MLLIEMEMVVWMWMSFSVTKNRLLSKVLENCLSSSTFKFINTTLIRHGRPNWVASQVGNTIMVADRPGRDWMDADMLGLLAQEFFATAGDCSSVSCTIPMLHND